MRFGDVPALVAHQARPEDAAARGTVLLITRSGRRRSCTQRISVCSPTPASSQSGFYAIAHGERRFPGGYGRFIANPREALLEVVSATAAEVPALVDELVRRRSATPGRIGIAGVSLGGFVAYGAAIPDRRIAAAVTIAASPRWGADPRSPHRHPGRFHPLALLSIMASDDALVRPQRPARSTGTWSRTTRRPQSACVTSSFPASRTGCPPPRGAAPARRRSAGSTGSSWARPARPTALGLRVTDSSALRPPP